MKTSRTLPLLALLGLALPPAEARQAGDLRKQALDALKKAVTYYRGTVASHGGYVYYYDAENLKERWGEGKAAVDTIFVQPPGTPAVGMAYLDVYDATQDKFYLEAATDAAMALVNGQLESGGWTQVIHFGAPLKGNLGKYRKRPDQGGKFNNSSLDDDQTQSSLMFLIRIDRKLDFKHAEIHEAVQYCLEGMLKAQHPNGSFSQSWVGPVENRPVMKASYPDYDWRTEHAEHKAKDYWRLYTLNDDLAQDILVPLIEAHKVYKDEKVKAAIEKLGDFLVMAQMPDPQPAWAQQYNFDMRPGWARKFEPPAISGGESQGVMETLMDIFEHTGNRKYLEPIPPAIAYLRKSLLPDGRLARYYELESNKPLYMNQAYELTYDDSSAPSHYGWKVGARLDRIEARYKAILGGARGTSAGGPPAGGRGGRGGRGGGPPQSPEDQVRKIIADLDDQGRWVSTYGGEGLVGQPKFQRGFRYLNSSVFIRNLAALSRFLSPAK